MVASTTRSPRLRGVLHGIFVCVLLTGPLWVGALHIGEPADQYERTEVVATGDGIEYADERAATVRLSDDIECIEGTWERRTCAFESDLRDAGFAPSGAYTADPADAPAAGGLFEPDYAFVQLDDGVYEPTYVANESARRADGRYRIDLALEPADPEAALERVSIDANVDGLPSVVVETARSGPTTTHRDVAVPETPIALGDRTYYRVYRSGKTDDPPLLERVVAFAFTYIGPAIGLVSFTQFAWRIEISYDDGRAD